MYVTVNNQARVAKKMHEPRAFFGDECLILYSYRHESKWQMIYTKQVFYVILCVKYIIQKLTYLVWIHPFITMVVPNALPEIHIWVGHVLPVLDP